jgi:hypothetical protein
MKSRYTTIQTMLRAAYAAVYVIDWLPGVSEAWSKGVICEQSPKLAIANSLAVTRFCHRTRGLSFGFCYFRFWLFSDEAPDARTWSPQQAAMRARRATVGQGA